jgi:hypothetical protein
VRPDDTVSSQLGASVAAEPAPPTARTRRALLAAGLGGLAATIAGALGRPSAAEAAAGDSLIIGSSTNNAGTSNTILTTTSTVVAFELLQNGAGTALMGYVTPTSGTTRGVYGRTDSPNGDGVQARNAGAGGSGSAIRAYGGNNAGLVASTSSGSAYAVYAVNSATGIGDGGGVYGSSVHDTGLYGTGGSYGVYGTGGTGVHGYSSGGDGVAGASDSFHGVSGYSTSSSGVFGSSNSSYGVFGSSSSDGVHGGSSGQFGAGVSGTSTGTDGHGVVGSLSTDSGNASGVYGASAGSTSFAGYFEGKVAVTGTLSKGGGSFRIDHPLAPATKILQHSFVESPDMLNIYNGVVSANGKGEATVTLPAWFMALNRDFRYQLTAIGRPAPDLHVNAKVAAGRFTIAGAKPGQEVSWQLTGIRRDAWANANRIAVELDKPADQRGKYLHPAAHGKPLSAGVDYPMQQRLAAMLAKDAAAATTG